MRTDFYILPFPHSETAPDNYVGGADVFLQACQVKRWGQQRLRLSRGVELRPYPCGGALAVHQGRNASLYQKDSLTLSSHFVPIEKVGRREALREFF